LLDDEAASIGGGDFGLAAWFLRLFEIALGSIGFKIAVIDHDDLQKIASYRHNAKVRPLF
ncbi:MAG: hypothetical protein ABWY49_05390, partial [Rhizobium sp.]